MPKPTFFNLPEEKQETLIDAGKNEFSRVPLYKASISNIIKTAEIPRGSFYQYFEDIEDLFLYILDGLSGEIKDYLMISLKNSEGDVFYAFTEMYKHLIKNFSSAEHQKFFKNAFLNMNHKIEKAISPSLSKEGFNQQLVEFINLVDMSKLNITSKEEVPYILQIIMAILMQNTIQYFAKGMTHEEALENYTKKINMIKKGIYKEEN